MLQLPELAPEERAHLQSLRPGSAMPALADRLRQRLVATLGTEVSVYGLAGRISGLAPGGDEPEIRIGSELAAAWLAVRFGGRPGAGCMKHEDDALCRPFRMLIRRVLAETAVNAGPDAAWPAALGLNVAIGGQQGVVEIYWNSEHAPAWAHRAIREKP